jgi:hypothetical protein
LNQKRKNDHWISPLLTQLNLIPAREAISDPRLCWKNIEECRLLERVGSVMAEINDAVGYHLLEMLEYLPPQDKVCRVSFDRNRVQYKMELIMREEGMVLVFSAAKHISARWDRYFPQSTRKDNSTVVWEQPIRPEEVLDQNIQAWLSYLLSGFDKQFRLDQILRSSSTAETDLSAALRKASA